MLAFDLSSTPLATSDEPGPVPSDCELCAILNALITVEQCSFEALRHRELVLNDENIEAVARAVHARFPLLFQRAVDLHGVRVTLDWYVGLTVFRDFDGA